MGYIVAGIEIHKKVLMVVVTHASTEDLRFERFRCGAHSQKRKGCGAHRHPYQELLAPRCVLRVPLKLPPVARKWSLFWRKRRPAYKDISLGRIASASTAPTRQSSDISIWLARSHP
jgi:hypothetical protein